MIFQKVYRWEHGALQLPPGQLARREAIREYLEKGFNNIYFAGESFPISSLEASYKSGLNAAGQVIAKLQNGR